MLSPGALISLTHCIETKAHGGFGESSHTGFGQIPQKYDGLRWISFVVTLWPNTNSAKPHLFTYEPLLKQYQVNPTHHKSDLENFTTV